MWRWGGGGARNERAAGRCGRCGMASPFSDDDRTHTIGIPAVDPEPSRPASSSLPWAVVAVAVLALLALIVIEVVTLVA